MTTPPTRVPPLVPDSRRPTSRTSSRPGCQRRGIRTHGCPGAQPSCLRGGAAAPIGSMASDGLVIVGASLAGAKAAEGARDGGWGGAIRLAGAEWHLPYERPPLSKGVMQGSEQPSVARVQDDGFYAGHEIEILLGAAATGIDLADSTVILAGGRRLRLDKLVLATGATVRRIPGPGAELDGVCYLRSLDDALGLRDLLQPGRRLAVVGASWFGTEVAASARQRGTEVVM